ncbi:MAG TPA: STAS domain-containing protein [Spirochaetota bacterium]|nr:STAS domain-containing protein [Spirochaetota bacterium]HPR37633.1 STAS domain-containing protein [Spirochaetota bacterium]HRX46778.1 STAS domain-containing protein [Spirochaetota bacterium]
MQFVYKYVENVPVISFKRDDGSLVGYDVNIFGEEVISILREDSVKIALDLRNNPYLNSFGLGELINIRHFFIERGISCVLIVESKKIHKLLEMVGIEDLFETVTSEDQI